MVTKDENNKNICNMILDDRRSKVYEIDKDIGHLTIAKWVPYCSMLFENKL